MKPSRILAILLLAAPALAAHAQYTGPSTHGLTTVQALLADGKDDQSVELQGRVIRHLGGERYTFADASGTIEMEIDDTLWRGGLRIGEHDEVRVSGELETNRHRAPHVDAKRIERMR